MMETIKKENETKRADSSRWQCYWSKTLGALEDTHQKVWGTTDYENDTDPTVFFGLYGLPDFYALWRHKGPKHILWAGSDITHFRNGYWLDKNGFVRLDPQALIAWINVNCTNWVENELEFRALNNIGLKCEKENVVPSFLGDVTEFELSFRPGNKIYTSVSGDDFELYGWYKIPELACKSPGIEFHLYGNNKVPPIDLRIPNIVLHGRVPKEVMNEEIKEMQGALRLTEFDGCSEILVKSWLMGQYPISLIHYPYTLNPNVLGKILSKTKPNLSAREYYLNQLNNYPWSIKK